MILESSAFPPGGRIPLAYSCEGDRKLSPPLSWSDVPDGTVSFALIVDDPDVPKELKPDGVFDHWILFNIPRDVRSLSEGQSVGVHGTNTRGETNYTGPCPPKDHIPSEHRYVFRLYALDSELGLQPGATKQEVLEELSGHELDTATLIGSYEKIK